MFRGFCWARRGAGAWVRILSEVCSARLLKQGSGSVLRERRCALDGDRSEHGGEGKAALGRPVVGGLGA